MDRTREGFLNVFDLSYVNEITYVRSGSGNKIPHEDIIAGKETDSNATEGFEIQVNYTRMVSGIFC